MRQRRPNSPLFGFIWFEQPIGPPQSAPPVRHWCDQGDGLKSYGWTHHNGRDFGRQKLVEKSDLTLQTDWISEGDSWTARIAVASAKSAIVSLIFYLSVQVKCL
jgi:mannosyl-oligosaccharide glucosidase